MSTVIDNRHNPDIKAKHKVQNRSDISQENKKTISPKTQHTSSVVLSDEAVSMQELFSKIQHSSGIDEQKVVFLQNAIEQNTYVVDADAVAESLIHGGKGDRF